MKILLVGFFIFLTSCSNTSDAIKTQRIEVTCPLNYTHVTVDTVIATNWEYRGHSLRLRNYNIKNYYISIFDFPSNCVMKKLQSNN